MYIDTTTIETMEQSVYQLLNINKEGLDELYKTCYNKFQNNHQVFILDDQYDFFLEYVKKHIVDTIDKVMFVHLSRRLNKDNDNNGYNLIDTLTKETILSMLLKQYGITFSYDQYIKMYINDKEIDLSNNKYLKQRLEYYDYAFKGYAFNDNLINNDFYEVGKGGPEFFGYLYPYDIDIDAIIDDFIANSTFYQFEYVVPLKDIEFESYEDLNEEEKMYHIIIKTLQRLYFDKYDPLFNKQDNLIVKMKDDKILLDKYLINKIEIRE